MLRLRSWSLSLTKYCAALCATIAQFALKSYHHPTPLLLVSLIVMPLNLCRIRFVLDCNGLQGFRQTGTDFQGVCAAFFFCRSVIGDGRSTIEEQAQSVRQRMHNGGASGCGLCGRIGLLFAFGGVALVLNDVLDGGKRYAAIQVIASGVPRFTRPRVIRAMLLVYRQYMLPGVSQAPAEDGRLALCVNQAHERCRGRRVHIAQLFSELFCHKS